MSYQLLIEKRPLRFLERLPRDVAARVAADIEALQHDPRPPDARALKGRLQGMLRIRVGDYRVVYHVDDRQLLVRVANIGHRSRIYD